MACEIYAGFGSFSLFTGEGVKVGAVMAVVTSQREATTMKNSTAATTASTVGMLADAVSAAENLLRKQG